MKVLIVGGVAGGASTATRLRRLDESAEIVMFERGEYVSYANCGLPYHIGGTIEDRDRLFVQTVEGFTSRFNIDVRVKSEVTAIDPKAKSITVHDLANDKVYTESYDKLVLSTGAEPIRPTITGIENKKIMSLRTVPDMDRIKDYINQHKPRKAVVIGGGFIGLEMVENLHDAGLTVTIVEKADQVMTPIDYTMATMVHQHLKSKGVNLMLDENVVAFEDDGRQMKVVLESDKDITADLVILSIGVLPETKLAVGAGLELGSMGGIKVDGYMQSSDKDIYAVGDAVEVLNPIIGKHVLIPLAGPANKQGRMVANNLVEGNKYKYTGTTGTSIAKVFDLTVAAAGASSKLLNREQIPHLVSYTHGHSHAGYYPNSLPLSIQINFSPTDGKLLGAQVIGFDGVDKRIDLLAQVIRKGGTIYDLQEIEHAYAPPYSSAKDPVNMAGFVAENILTGKMKHVHWNELKKMEAEGAVLVDVRTKEEFEMGHIAGALNVELDDLRNQFDKLPRDKTIIIYCAIGLRGYLASRILLQNGYGEVYNLSGGYKTFSTVSDIQSSTSFDNEEINNKPLPPNNMEKEIRTIAINACGLQCPGPIMQLKKSYDEIADGDQIEIKVTDQSFGEDLKGWTNMMGAKLVGMQNDGGIITARVEKMPKTTCANPLVGATDNKTLIVFSDDLDRALASFVIANGAAASGKKVSIFFTFWGLNVIKRTSKPKVKKDILGRMFGMMLPANSKHLGLSQMNMGGLGTMMMRYIMKKKNVDSLEHLLKQAMDNGVEFIACSMSMDVMGIKKEELMDGITVGGVAAYLDRAEKANVNLFI